MTLLLRPALLNRLKERDERVDTDRAVSSRSTLLASENITPDRHDSIAMSRGSTARDDLS